MKKIELLLALFFLVLLSAIVLQYSIPLFSSVARDNGVFLYMGEQIVKGKLPYVDAWDQKPPIIFYINALGLMIGKGTRWGVFLIEFIFILISGLISYNLIKHLWHPDAALFSCTLWMLGLSEVLEGGNLTEEYSLPLSFLSLYLFFSAEKQQKLFSYIWIGICFGLSFFIRPNNTGTQISIGLSLLISHLFHGKTSKSIQKIGLMAAGSIVVFFVVVAYFASQGILYPMIENAFLYNLSYGSKMDVLGSLLSGSAHLANIWWLLVIGYFSWGISIVNRYKQNCIKPDAFDIAPIILLPIEILLSGLSGRNYPHYFISWLPISALMSGFVYSSIFPPSTKTQKSKFIVVFLLLISFLLISNPNTINLYRTAAQRIVFERYKGIEMRMPIIDYIRNNTHPTDTVLVWAYRPGINFLAKRDTPTAYFGYPLYVVNSPFTAKYETRFYEDILSTPPELIVDSSFLDPDSIPSLNPERRKIQKNKKGMCYPDNIEIFFEFLDTNYHVEAQVDEYTIYRINK